MYHAIPWQADSCRELWLWVCPRIRRGEDHSFALKTLSCQATSLVGEFIKYIVNFPGVL